MAKEEEEEEEEKGKGEWLDDLQVLVEELQQRLVASLVFLHGRGVLQVSFHRHPAVDLRVICVDVFLHRQVIAVLLDIVRVLVFAREETHAP